MPLNLVQNLFNVNPNNVIRLILAISMLISRQPARLWINERIMKGETNPRDKPSEHLTWNELEEFSVISACSVCWKDRWKCPLREESHSFPRTHCRFVFVREFASPSSREKKSWKREENDLSNYTSNNLPKDLTNFTYFSDLEFWFFDYFGIKI